MLADRTGIARWRQPLPGRAPLRWSAAPSSSVDVSTVREAAADVEPLRPDRRHKVSSLMQLERLRPDAYDRVRGVYIARQRPQATHA
jgi:hypothetical protein